MNPTTTALDLPPGPAPGPGATEADLALRGVLSVLQTPFLDNEALDLTSLQRQIDWLFDQGTDGVVTGMVSELLRLGSDERDDLVAATCAAVAGRGPVVIGVGAESTHLAVRQARAASGAGATAVMATPPALFPADDEQLTRYFLSIAEVGLPLVVQDASGYVGGGLSIALQARLFAELGEQVLFKPESPPVGPKLSALLDATGGGAQVFEGTGGLYLIESFRRGVVGTMPAGDLVWALVPLWRALRAEDFDRAYDIAGPLSMLIALQTSLDSFIAVEKHLLQAQGVLPSARMRGPVGVVGDAVTWAEVDRLVARLRRVVDHG